MCSASTGSKVEMKLHIERVHSLLEAAENDDEDVSECEMEIAPPPSDEEEEDMETNKKPLRLWQCLACRQLYPSKRELQQHFQDTHVQTETHDGPLQLEMRGYGCEICGRCFDEFDYLFAHHQVKHPEAEAPLNTYLKNYRRTAILCFICMQYFCLGKWHSYHQCVNEIDFETAEQTKRIAEANEYFICDVCAVVFKWKCIYQHHRETKHKDMTAIDWDAVGPAAIPYVCAGCSKGFVMEAAFRQHVCAQGEYVVKSFGCDLCGTKLATRKSLRRHMKSFHDEKSTVASYSQRQGICYRPTEPTIKCPFCELLFRTARETLQHAKDVHNQVLQSPYFCPLCSKTFGENKKLMIHHKIYHSVPEDASEEERICVEAEVTASEGPYYVCKSCPRKFLDRRSYCMHYRWHQATRDFTCERCGKLTATSSALRSHIRIVHEKKVNKEASTYECDVCHKKLSSKFWLKEHLAAHAGVKSFTCEKCGQNFVSKPRLQLHMRAHFFGTPSRQASVKRHKCSICPKEFKKKQTLRDHLTVHSGVKSVPCTECDEMFLTKIQAYFHKLRVHVTDRPFKCELCDAAFPIESFLKRHVKLHSSNSNTDSKVWSSNEIVECDVEVNGDVSENCISQTTTH